MKQGGIFNAPNALGVEEDTTTTPVKYAHPDDDPNADYLIEVDENEPQAWWQQEVKTTPWWYDTPTLMKPVQTRPWYLPEEEGPSTPEIIEAREAAANTRAGLIVAGILAAGVLLSGALGRRVF